MHCNGSFGRGPLAVAAVPARKLHQIARESDGDLISMEAVEGALGGRETRVELRAASSFSPLVPRVTGDLDWLCAVMPLRI